MASDKSQRIRKASTFGPSSSALSKGSFGISGFGARPTVTPQLPARTAACFHTLDEGKGGSSSRLEVTATAQASSYDGVGCGITSHDGILMARPGELPSIKVLLDVDGLCTGSRKYLRVAREACFESRGSDPLLEIIGMTKLLSCTKISRLATEDVVRIDRLLPCCCRRVAGKLALELTLSAGVISAVRAGVHADAPR